MNESEQTDDLDKVKISGLQLWIWHSSDSLNQVPETLLWPLPSGHCLCLWRRALLQSIVTASSSRAGLEDVSEQSLSVHRTLTSAIWVAPHLSQGSQTEQTRFMCTVPTVISSRPGVRRWCWLSCSTQGNHVLAPTALNQHFIFLQSRIVTQLPVWGLLQLCVTPKCLYDSSARHGWRGDVPMLFLEQEELPGTGFLSNGNFFLRSRYICSGGKDIVFLEGREPVLLKSFALTVSY